MHATGVLCCGGAYGARQELIDVEINAVLIGQHTRRTSCWSPFQTVYLAATTQLDDQPSFGQLGQVSSPQPTRTKYRRQPHLTLRTHDQNAWLAANEPRVDILFKLFHTGTHGILLPPLSPTKTTTH